MAHRPAHAVRRMTGRDPHEASRVSTPLELLFDLTFVIAFSVAAADLAHAVSAGHTGAGLTAFSLVMFAVPWAWINYSWFASAYDTDDWIFRLTTMAQMVGVLIFALGIDDAFASLAHGEHLDMRVIVLGYVVMRVPMVAQWLRAGRQDVERRAVCRYMATNIVLAQCGWTVLSLLDLPNPATFALAAVLVLVEIAGPARAERIGGGTPWHAHHMAERYSLLVIITLGEGIVGTMATLSSQVGPDGPGWTLDVAVLGLAGVALTFGIWWTYFVIEWGELLHARRSKSFGFGYGHIPLLAALVAVGAGLHAAANLLIDESELGVVGTVVAVAVPVGAYVLLMFAHYSHMTDSFDPFHALLIAGSALVIAAALVLAAAGASIEWCLAVLALTPWVTVVGYELVGHRHQADALAAQGSTTTQN